MSCYEAERREKIFERQRFPVQALSGESDYSEPEPGISLARIGLQSQLNNGKEVHRIQTSVLEVYT